jgi:hypothetical protein
MILNIYKFKFISEPTRVDCFPANYAVEVEARVPVDLDKIECVLVDARHLDTPHEIADHVAELMPGKQTITSWHQGVQVVTVRGSV